MTSFTYFMLFLSFPIGFLVAVTFGLLAVGGLYLPAGLTFVAVAWPLFVVAGYCQWFIILPAAIRKVRQTSNPTVEGDARKSGARPSRER